MENNWFQNPWATNQWMPGGAEFEKWAAPISNLDTASNETDAASAKDKPIFTFRQRDDKGRTSELVQYEEIEYKRKNYIEPAYDPKLSLSKQPRNIKRNLECEFYLGAAQIKNVANSVQTLYGRDVDYRKERIGRFTGVYTLTEEDIKKVLGYARYIFYDRFSNASTKIETIVKTESGGLLDFKIVLYLYILDELKDYRHHLIEIDNIVYNANEAGNYLWGMALDFHGIFIRPEAYAQSGTVVAGIIDHFDFWSYDEAWEQRAIASGTEKGSKLPTYTQDQKFHKLVDVQRDYYAKKYFKSLFIL
jgi:hypothetical protein